MRVAGVLVAVLLFLSLAPAAFADDTFDVDVEYDLADGSPGDGLCSIEFSGPGDCTLRAALMEANSDPDSDVVNVPAGTYQLTVTNLSGSSNDTGDLDVTEGTTIIGAGARETAIVGLAGQDDRVMVSTAALSLQGVTIKGGGDSIDTDPGAGIAITGTAVILDSTIAFNTMDDLSSPTASGGGIWVAASGNLEIQRSTIMGNSADVRGGGIFAQGTVNITNSTFFDNSADAGGAIAADSSAITNVSWSTIVGNNAESGPALDNFEPGTNFGRNIVAQNGVDQQCSGVLPQATENLESGSDCFTNGIGNIQDATLDLGAIDDNGGPTDTFFIGLDSDARELIAPDSCPSTDQRGTTRPQGVACDAGSVEVRPDEDPPPEDPPGEPPPTDTGTTTTTTSGPLPSTNVPPQRIPIPNLLSLEPASAQKRPGDANAVAAAAIKDDGTPASGATLRWAVTGANPSSGAVTLDSAGRGSIAWEGVHDGKDMLIAYVDSNNNVSRSEDEPAATATVDWVLPPPEIRKAVNIDPVSGTVLVKLPKTASPAKRDPWTVAAQAGFIPLEEAKSVPINTIVNADRGRIELSSAANKSGGSVQNGQFYSGQFQIKQTTGSRPFTELRMNATLTCPKSTKKVDASGRTRRSRGLWGNGKGRFRTRGRHSSASVRGTVWYTKDTCTTTTTVVREGTVVVADFAKDKNVTVKAPKRYVARAKKKRKIKSR